MATFKCVISDGKEGKSYQKALEDTSLVGKKIGDKISGDILGLEGYELEIRGGSDAAGFPLRKDVHGPIRKRALLGKGIGARIKRSGMKRRKTVCGNQITEKTAQVNLVVRKAGKEDLAVLFAPKEEEAAAPAAE